MTLTLPSFILSRASWQTVLSAPPPPIHPSTTRPSVSTITFDPGLADPDPCTLITVAIANGSPRDFSSCAVPKKSSKTFNKRTHVTTGLTSPRWRQRKSHAKTQSAQRLRQEREAQKSAKNAKKRQHWWGEAPERPQGVSREID